MNDVLFFNVRSSLLSRILPNNGLKTRTHDSYRRLPSVTQRVFSSIGSVCDRTLACNWVAASVTRHVRGCTSQSTVTFDISDQPIGTRRILLSCRWPCAICLLLLRGLIMLIHFIFLIWEESITSNQSCKAWPTAKPETY